MERAGFRLDVDTRPSEGMRVVQMTFPGSACSITIGEGLGLADPGSVRGLHLVVADIVAARDELVERGVEVSEVRHFDREAGGLRLGPDPSPADYGSFADFADPGGSTWVLQEVGHESAAS